MMRVYIGTSGYSYKEWKGSFYPEDLPASKFLEFYSSKLKTVEINNTFYRMPTEKVIAQWASEVPAGFVFAVKAPQRITHQERLKGSNDSMKRFLDATNVLKDKLGPFLFQLPPFLKKDLPLLTDFVNALPADRLCSFEFRHPSWFSDDVYAALGARNCAFVLAESEKVSAPRVATADWGYLRLRREDYVDKDVLEWGDWIAAQSWKRAFVYFKHEDAGIGPKLAKKLIAHLGPERA